jgi:N6-adenosine-specific RNA methylase IME4
LSRTGTKFRDYLVSLRLDKNRALEAQRIGAMPADEREKVIAAACERGDDPSFAELLIWARPYWYQASRKARHRRIVDAAADRAKPNLRGPFPLIYADPPWKFAVYSDKGLDRTPDQHYPTLTDDEISAFRVDGRPIDKIAHRDAALFLWCTSSNVHRALPIMAAWGFTFKTSAAWDKVRSGTGLVFRNRHELLLYGTRGNMPGPQYQPQSVFVHERGEHSAKPPEIRAEIERMYPDFDARTRLELFARETVAGWTSFGHETDRADSAKPDR